MRKTIADGVATVEVVGDLDIATVDAARAYVEATLAAGPGLTLLVLDLSAAPWVDSVGLGLLVAVRTRCQDAGVALRLRGLAPKVLRILTLSGLTELFDIESGGTGPSNRAERRALPDELRLPAAADQKFDQIAELTRRAVDAPRAFVTMVDATRQAFPGAAGVPDDAERQQPIAYSLCQYVVTSGEPLVVPDAARDADELVRTNQAVVEGMLSAYAGMPLTDLNGSVVGTLCVADDEPREWSSAQLQTLSDLAAVASSELQLRSAVSQAAVSADRERIVSSLNDQVFNELLSLSMMIGSAQSITSGRAGAILDEAALKVDGVLKSIRATIFDRTA